MIIKLTQNKSKRLKGKGEDPPKYQGGGVKP